MVGHGGSSAGSYLADPTSPIPSHCVSIVVLNASFYVLQYVFTTIPELIIGNATVCLIICSVHVVWPMFKGDVQRHKNSDVK